MAWRKEEQSFQDNLEVAGIRRMARCAPHFDEIKWVIEIRHKLDEVPIEEEGAMVTIFITPKPLQLSKPEAFAPQLVAIGPYHHWRTELYDMERFKLSAAKRVMKQKPNSKFQDLVDEVLTYEFQIRDNYQKHLDFNGETLGWMMAVDGCFLLEFLHVYKVVDMENMTRLTRISSRMSHLVDASGMKSGHNTILRDIMMLENQIPLFLLIKILDWQYSSKAEIDEVLCRILTGFLREVCPFVMPENYPNITDVYKNAHLLDLLYHTLMPKETPADMENVNIEYGGNGLDSTINGDPCEVKQLCCTIWSLASVTQFIKRSRPVLFLSKLPWSRIFSLPVSNMLRRKVKLYLLENDDENQPPRVEEIMIPSVKALKESGVRFSPTKGDLSSIGFDSKTASFKLPTITLDVNTEVILRNLVSYETLVAPGPLVLTRYTELMNGIIDTDEDVKLLRDDGIIVNRMKCDGDIAGVWNGMSKSVRLTRVGFIDKVIVDVNMYHNSRWKVKIKRFMRRYVYGAWPILTFLAAILLLLLNALQTFCSVYRCARWLNDIPVVAVEE